jgi:hypothetical protein
MKQTVEVGFDRAPWHLELGSNFFIPAALQ